MWHPFVEQDYTLVSTEEFMAESPVRFRDFLVLCLKEAIRTTWDKGDKGATVAGIIIPAIVHFVPSWEHAMGNIAWEIPVACVASIVGVRLLLSPFLIYRKRDEEAKRAVARLEAELQQERNLGQQPDVALVWDWVEDQREKNALLGRTEKDILVHNRGNEWVYRVRIAPISLVQEMTFDEINEIAPRAQHCALARWNGRSSLATNYVYFFGKEENGQEASNKGWVYKKIHNRELSDHFLKVPMSLTYECKGATWECVFDFEYNSGEQSAFVKKSGRRVLTSQASALIEKYPGRPVGLK
jgi:hypothetical protein